MIVFSEKIEKLLRKIGRAASLEGARAYIVGGLVRDILIQGQTPFFKRKMVSVPIFDLDVVIEGDAIKLGRFLSEDLGGRLTAHKRFGTCTLALNEGIKIDLASARSEEYGRPACLPTVKFCALKEDLARRDFTINAMAMSLAEGDFGKLIDFFGGEDDLKSGRIRVLHDKSFIDDPTRILRAVRFEQRLGFSIDAHTKKLILDAVRKKMLTAVEPQRVRDELVLILKEKYPLKAIRRMAALHEFKFIHPKLRLNKNIIRLCSWVGNACDWYERSPSRKPAIEKWLIYLMALTDHLSYRDVAALERKFAFRKTERVKMLLYKKYGKRSLRLLSVKTLAPSAVYDILSRLPHEAVVLVLAASASRITASRIKAYLENYSLVRTHIGGHDIKALGLKPGPRFARILGKVLHAKIDGIVKTKEAELEYAKKLLTVF